MLQDKGLKTAGTNDDLFKRLISANPVSEISDNMDPEDSVSRISSASLSNFAKAQRTAEAARRAELESRASLMKENSFSLRRSYV